MSDYSRRNGGTSGGTSNTGRSSVATETDARRPRRRNIAGDGRSRSTGRMIVGNTAINVNTNKILNMLDVLSELQINGFVSESLLQTKNSQVFLHILNGLGFETVSNEELSPGIDNLKKFSLIGSENNDQTIENPNIVDPDLSLLTPVEILANDKFKSATDAFYELDESAPDSLKQSIRNQKRKQTVILRPLTDQIARTVKRSKNKMITKDNRKSSR